MDLDKKYLNLDAIATSIMQGTYPDVTTTEIDTLASETAASMGTQHPDYGRLAARICASHNHKMTPKTFSESIRKLFNNGNGFVCPKLVELVERRGKEIDDKIMHEKDMGYTYFGFKTLERSYLLKTEKGEVVERPQYMIMRVALGIHCCSTQEGNDEDANLEAAFETYNMMSKGYFTHASPTLFHSGTIHPQLSSCFLVQMSEDSIDGIYNTLKRCAMISKVCLNYLTFHNCISVSLNFISIPVSFESLLGVLVYQYITFAPEEHILKEQEVFQMV